MITSMANTQMKKINKLKKQKLLKLAVASGEKLATAR